LSLSDLPPISQSGDGVAGLAAKANTTIQARQSTTFHNRRAFLCRPHLDNIGAFIHHP
jgi:hypothetical protein